MLNFICLNFVPFCFDPNKTHTRISRKYRCWVRYFLFLCLDLLHCLLGHEAAHPLGRILLHLPGNVGVGVQGEARAVMPQNVGCCLGVYSLLDRQRGEGVPLWHNKDKSENPCIATG